MRMWEIRENSDDYRYGRKSGMSGSSSMRNYKDDLYEEGYECGFEDGYREAMKEAKSYYGERRSMR